MLIKNEKVFVDQFELFVREFDGKENEMKNLMSFLIKLLDVCQARKTNFLIEKEHNKKKKV